ncbi:MAG: hypothetical protein ACP5E4_01575 [Candidatus Aenigmatarchaeota archaeon]
MDKSTTSVAGECEKPSIEEINELLTESFGGDWLSGLTENSGYYWLKKFLGKRKVYGNLRSAVGIDDTWFVEEEYLELIGISSRVGLNETIVGKFPKRDDGSDMVVRPEYETKAIKYCGLYEKKTGKPAAYRLSDNL